MPCLHIATINTAKPKLKTENRNESNWLPTTLNNKGAQIIKMFQKNKTQQWQWQNQEQLQTGGTGTGATVSS